MLIVAYYRKHHTSAVTPRGLLLVGWTQCSLFMTAKVKMIHKTYNDDYDDDNETRLEEAAPHEAQNCFPSMDKREWNRSNCNIQGLIMGMRIWLIWKTFTSKWNVKTKFEKVISQDSSIARSKWTQRPSSSRVDLTLRTLSLSIQALTALMCPTRRWWWWWWRCPTKRQLQRQRQWQWQRQRAWGLSHTVF